MEVVDEIANCDVDMWSNKPFEDQKMVSVTVDCFGVDYPEPEMC